MKLIKNLIPYLIIIIVVVLIRTFIVTPVKVNGTSMFPTLEGGEIMLLNRLATIDRFDIVVAKVDERNDNLIKRVIGLPGEKIKIEYNKIYINDKILEDPYGIGEKIYHVSEVTLGEDEYFILGDNRDVSIDSRVFGKIKRENIKGTSDFIIFPFKKLGKIS